MFEALKKLSTSTAKAAQLLSAVQSGRPHAPVLVKPHHRWGKNAAEAKQIAQDWRLAEVKSITETMLKPLS